jgi:hypothetical protein
MLKWLLGSKNNDKKVEAKMETSVAVEVATPPKPTPKRLHPCSDHRGLNEKRVISIEPAKAGDELVTINPHYKNPLWKHKECGCEPLQYLRRKDGNWYYYPSFTLYATGFDRIYEEYKVRRTYEAETPLMIAIQTRQSEVKCIYCHSQLQAKAQVCLKCGGFLCLACAPTVEKCPTLGCQ